MNGMCRKRSEIPVYVDDSREFGWSPVSRCGRYRLQDRKITAWPLDELLSA